MKRLIITIASLLVILFQTPVSGSEAHHDATMDTRRPNIIFILTDDQRADSLGFMGNPVCRTPNLDQLAEEAVVFERAYVTSAICTPSRASYFLGQYERRHGINFNSGTSMAREAWENSYPVQLRKAGYVTAYIGKNHVPIGEKGYYTGIIEQSFDYWYAGHHHLTFYPKERHAIFDNAKADTQVEVLEEGIMAFLEPGSNADFIAKAEQFLQVRPADKPFCLSLCLNVPHGASTSTMRMRPQDPEIYRTLYRDLLPNLPLPPHYVPKDEIKMPKLPPDVLRTDLRQEIYDYVNTPETLREMMVREYQTITGVDAMIGRLRAKLAELGLADNTILVFTSDHGIMHGEFGLGGKALCYEDCMRVPLVIYDPRLPENQRGRRLKDLVLSIDLAPTMLRWAGAEPPDTMQGRDLTPLLSGQSTDWRSAAFGENLWSNVFGNPRCETVRTADWRYIRYFRNDNDKLRAKTPPDMIYVNTPEIRESYRIHLTSTILGEPAVYEELFNMTDDPEETRNLVDDPTCREVLEEMRRLCDRLVREAKGELDVPPATIRIDPKWEKPNYRIIRHD